MWRAALLYVALVGGLNYAVAFVGATSVFPLSPRHIPEKLEALGRYAVHRPRCLFREHVPHDTLALGRAAERRHGIPRGLLAALVRVESDGRAHRISAAGAMGPCQLMPGTARELGVRDPYEPAESIDGCARYLARQLRRYRRIPLALAAYNAGPGNVGRVVPQNGETEHYVARVLREYRRERVTRR